MALSVAQREAVRDIEVISAREADSRTLRQQVAARLSRLVYWDAACICTVDPWTLLVTDEISYGIPPEMHAHAAHNEYLVDDVHKFATIARSGAGVAIMGRAPRELRDASPRLQTIMPQIDARHEVRAACTVDGQCWGAIAMFRTGTQPDFSSAEAALLQAVAAPLAAGLRRTAYRPGAGVGITADKAGPGVLILGPHGETLAANDAAHQWLDELMPAKPRGADGLPIAIHQVAARVRAGLAGPGGTSPDDKDLDHAPGWTSGAYARLRARSGRWMTVHGSPASGSLIQGQGTAVVIEAADGGRPGVPQGQHVHTLLPGGLGWMERWLPGLTKEMQRGGAVLADFYHVASYLDGHPQVETGDHDLLFASRPFMEARIRERVLGLPGVSVLQAQATGLEYRDGAVSGVRYSAGGESGVLAADIVVDAMGRGSRLTDWLAADGWDRPQVQRLSTAVNYATALLHRSAGPEELPALGAIARFGPPYRADGVAVAAASAIEEDQWIVMLMGYDDARPGRTLEALRAACAELPPPYSEAASGEPVTQIATYHQADSRRRDFAGLGRFPARLVSVGDAVASFNPIYGQGMSSAALHASCLAQYLSRQPDLHASAAGFFERQNVVVDAAWAISAGSDAARLDALSGADVPDEVSRQRWAMDQILRATLDEQVCRAFENVAFMVAHPDTLADPAILERAIAANSGSQA